MKATLINTSVRRKLTKREFFLISFLLVAVEAFFLFNYFVQPAWVKYTAQLKTLSTTESAVESLKKDFSKKAEYDTRLQEVSYKLDRLIEAVPPYASQEEVINFVDSIASENSLSIQSISFESTVLGPSATGLAANQQIQQVQVDAAAQTVNSANGPSLATQHVTLSYAGNFTSLYSFIDAVEKSMRKAFVTDLNIQQSSNNLLKGTLKLSMISMIDPVSDKKYPMDIESISGKSNPFMPFPGFGMQNAAGSENVPPLIPEGLNFYMLINTYMDSAPKVILAEYPKTETELYGNLNDSIKCKLDLTGSKGKFAYSYTVGGNTYTNSSQITIKNNKIVMQVVSQPRSSGDDKVSVVLDVDNNTGVPLEIIVKNDDNGLPRFKLGKTTGEVLLK